MNMAQSGNQHGGNQQGGNRKCVEIRWAVTPWRTDEFCEIWEPYAAAVIDYGASGYVLFRSLDDTQLVTQYAFFENKDDWDRYWNSERLTKGRQEINGMHQVPALYTWAEVITEGAVADEAVAAETEATPA